MLSASAFFAEKARVEAARAAGLLDAGEAAEQIAAAPSALASASAARAAWVARAAQAAQARVLGVALQESLLAAERALD